MEYPVARPETHYGAKFLRRGRIRQNSAVSRWRHRGKSPSSVNLASGQVDYNYFRYYDPATGRFITSDPIGIIAGLDPTPSAANAVLKSYIQDLSFSDVLSSGINHPYTYVNNNPINSTDPSGLICGTGICVGIVVYTVIGTYLVNWWYWMVENPAPIPELEPDDPCDKTGTVNRPRPRDPRLMRGPTLRR